jgi:hypothetical protein
MKPIVVTLTPNEDTEDTIGVATFEEAFGQFSEDTSPIRYVKIQNAQNKSSFDSDFNFEGEVSFSFEGNSEEYGNFNSDGETFYRDNFEGSDFDGDNFDGYDFDGYDFDGYDFDGDNFEGFDFDGYDFDGDNFDGFDFDGDNFEGEGFSDARGKRRKKKFSDLVKKIGKYYPPAVAYRMAKKVVAKNKKRKRKGIFSKGGFFDKGLADFDKKAGLSKGVNKVGNVVKNVFKKIATGATKAMAKALGGSENLKEKTDLFQKSGLAKKLDKKGTSLVRNIFRGLKINLGLVKIPVGAAITLWANTKKGRKALGKIPNKLGGYDLRKTFIFEGINVEEALKKAALDLGMGFTPLPSAATRAISNKAFKYKETRDGFDGNSYDFDGIEKNKDFH